MPRLAIIAFVLALVALYLWRGKKGASLAAGTPKAVEPNMSGHAVPAALTRPAKIAARTVPGYDPADSPPTQETVGIAHEDGSYTALDDTLATRDRYHVNGVNESWWATAEE